MNHFIIFFLSHMNAYHHMHICRICTISDLLDKIDVIQQQYSSTLSLRM